MRNNNPTYSRGSNFQFQPQTILKQSAYSSDSNSFQPSKNATNPPTKLYRKVQAAQPGQSDASFSGGNSDNSSRYSNSNYN